MINKLLISCVYIYSILPSITPACAVCYGDPESPMTAGLNSAIFLLLGVIGFILSIIFFTGIYFVRRAKRLDEAGSRV